MTYSEFKKQSSSASYREKSQAEAAAKAEIQSRQLADTANQKQINFFNGMSNIGVGAGLGAIGGGIVSLLPTSTSKKDRLRRAVMLMLQGGLIGGSLAGIGQYATGKTLSDVKDSIVSSYKDWAADRALRKQEELERHLAERGEVIA